MPDSPEIIHINYKAPKGQVGARPRPVRLKQAFEVRTDLPGEMSIEFIGNSPLKSGEKIIKVGEGKSFVADQTGRFSFKCSLNQDGNIIELGDPADPSSGIGGELEVHC